MGYNRLTWMPGRERRSLDASRFGQLERLRRQRGERASDRVAARALEGSLLSLTAMLGTEVRDPDGRGVGRLRDVVVQWTARSAYPRVKAIVVRSGGVDVVIGARWLEAAPPGMVRLHSSRAYATATERHPDDVALAHDILDRQLVDAGGVQIVRPADLYLASTRDRIELVGVEVGSRALLRRLGPKAWRSRFRPQRVIDWASISAFVPARSDGGAGHGRRTQIAGSAGAGIALDASAGEVKRLGPTEVQDALERLQSGGRTA